MRHLAATLALAIVGAPVLAQDRAVPRGGGSSGGGSSSSGGSHHSGGSSSSGSSGSSYSGGGSSSGGSHSSRTPSSAAERRHPRAGTGTGDRYYGGRRYYPGGGYYSGYSPWYPWYYPSSYYWGPYWGSYYYGYWPYGAYYGGGGYYRSYRSSSSDYEGGAVRVLVDPEDAKVYVDGYYAGTVDDFDGLMQRLHVDRGPHEVLVKREGYKSQRFRIYAVPGRTVKIEYDMRKGEGEDPIQDLSGGRNEDFDRRVREYRDRDDDDEPEAEAEEDDDASRPRVRVEEGDGPTGVLRMKVWPSDASVYVDGEFRGTARQVRSLDLGPGTHRIEVVRPGYATSQHEVDVRAGETRDLEVTLQNP